MAEFGSGTPHAAITHINVTPLVDITLVLLIIFMVTAKLIVSHKAMTVELPRAATGDQVQALFSIALSAQGLAEVNGEQLADDDAILLRARAAQHADHGLRAIINADAAVDYGRVVHVLDLLTRAGVGKVGFAVTPLAADAASQAQPE